MNEPAVRTPEPRRRSPERTCVACGTTDDQGELVRVVLGEGGQVAVDLAGSSFGRGAYLHAQRACIAKAKQGLSRSFREAVSVSPQELARDIQMAADRRAWGLLASAIRGHHAMGGREAVTSEANAARFSLMVVATDAGAKMGSSVVNSAVRDGLAVAFGTKESLGGLLGKAELSLLGITSPKLANAIRQAVTISTNVAFNTSATEDR